MNTYDPTTIASPPIRGDNRRLILTKDHDQWLARKWRYNQIWLWATGSLLAVTAIGLMAQMLVFLILSVLCPVWLALFVKASYEMRCIRTWQHDHHAFLRQYNRAHQSIFMPV